MFQIIKTVPRLPLPLLLIFAATIAIAQPMKEPRKELEAARLELTQIEAALQRENLDDPRLEDLRNRLEPVGKVIEEMTSREKPRADEIKARIDKLGAVPDAKAQPESADVAKDRAEQQKLWQEVDETLRFAGALALRVEQLGQAISERKRQNFTNQILAQQDSILSPYLWLELGRALPADIRAGHFLFEQWLEAILKNFEWHEALSLIAVFLFFIFARKRAWLALKNYLPFLFIDVENEHEGADVTHNQAAKLRRAVRTLITYAALPALFLLLFYGALFTFELLPGRSGLVISALLSGIAFVALVHALIIAVLSPTHSAWRILIMADDVAVELGRAIEITAFVIALGRVIEALNSAIVASLPLTMVTKAGISILVAVLMMRGLLRAFRPNAGEDAMLNPPMKQGQSLLMVRLPGWCAAFVIFGAAVIGYPALSRFLVSQVAWLTTLALCGVLCLALIDETLGIGLSAQGVVGRRVRQVTGLAASSLDQFSVLGSGLARLMLFITLGFLALAPWGIDSSSALGTVRAAFFGFQVGGVTISLSTIALALILFFIGFAATRSIQNWLETHYLPHTGLDIGLRNSIRTILGYIGIIITAMVALSQLGLSLDKLTIVAGALSVGIGFGLQSIVNNFVSGLILLWERPIRVGDWIVVGDEQGTVKHINVRATEIETFDRASLIIPNSEFISGRVKNWMHADRTGRIIIPVNVDYTADPQQVQTLLRDAALHHRLVMSEPKPIVIFKNLGESGMDFELRCFTDVDDMLITRSELLFDIFHRLQEAGIGIPYPTRRLEITTMSADGAASAAPAGVPPLATIAKAIS